MVLTCNQDMRIIWGLKSSCIPHGREKGKKNPLFKKPLSTDLNESTALLKAQSPVTFKPYRNKHLPNLARSCTFFKRLFSKPARINIILHYLRFTCHPHAEQRLRCTAACSRRISAGFWGVE